MAENKPRVTIYTDGGADPNPGLGGWGVILIHDATGKAKELSNSAEQTTINRMDLTAAIKALQALKQPCVVQIFTNPASAAVEEFLKTKKKRGRKSDDADLHDVLGALVKQHEVTWGYWDANDPHAVRVRELAQLGPAQWSAPSRQSQEFASEPSSTPRERADLPPVDAEVYLLATAQNKQGIWAVSVRIPGEDEMLEIEQEENLTSNQAHLMAALQVFYLLPEELKRIRIFTANEYLLNGATKWLKAWKQRNWRKKDGEPVDNQELWEELDYQMQGFRIDWRGLADDPGLELTFEDIGRRAQEQYEESFARNLNDQWYEA